MCAEGLLLGYTAKTHKGEILGWFQHDSIVLVLVVGETAAALSPTVKFSVLTSIAVDSQQRRLSHITAAVCFTEMNLS